MVLGLVCAGLTARPADAHVKRYNTTVQISSANTTQISGVVSSARSECFVGRTVTLTSDGGTSAGSDTTDANGVWQVVGIPNFGLGVYYTATVDKLVFKKSRAHKHSCREASDTEITS